jgi:predicted glycogen debranching enzyme
VAGYPWFSDWGRDTFIAMRGLCIAGDRLDDARDILLEWSCQVSEGMLPNFFPEGGGPPAFNSVDSSLWFVVAVHDLLRAAGPRGVVSPKQTEHLRAAVEAIVSGYARGTRFAIHADETGLLAAGEPGVQLTWMDAKLGDWVVTPRIGKPVEVQALWINALRVAGTRSSRWRSLAELAQRSFAKLFWFEEGGYLYDVVDVDHRRGEVDASLRPNQILAVGGLPWPLLDGEGARRVVAAVESRLWTPAGLRTLDPGSPEYAPRYAGDVRARDAAYHQGTAWPWLTGAFVEAWVRVATDRAAAKREARRRFLEPLLAHYAPTSPGQIAEVADGDWPHTPRGCPFQAWSVGEALRLSAGSLRPSGRSTPARSLKRI